MSNIIDFSPKRQFQTDEKIVKELLTVVNAGHFHIALSAALSEYVYRRTPSADQLHAVREFIATLLNLPTPNQPLPTFPVRTLDHSVYEPERPESHKTTTTPQRHD